jgi:hypothetical protein
MQFCDLHMNDNDRILRHRLRDDRLNVQTISFQLGAVIRPPLEDGSPLVTVTTFVRALQSDFLLFSPLLSLHDRTYNRWPFLPRLLSPARFARGGHSGVLSWNDDVTPTGRMTTSLQKQYESSKSSTTTSPCKEKDLQRDCCHGPRFDEQFPLVNGTGMVAFADL